MVQTPISFPEPWSLAWADQIAPLIQASVVLLTGAIAIHGLNAWRRQMVGKRKAELAEQVLTSFYEARDVFVWARSRGFFAGEGETRLGAGDEPDQVQIMMNTYFIPIERLVREKELFAKLHAQRYLFKAYYGEAATKPFKTFSDAHTEIQTTASILMKLAQYDNATRAVAASRDDLENRLGWGKRDRPDDLDRSLDQAVEEIESICKPILEGRHPQIGRLEG